MCYPIILPEKCVNLLFCQKNMSNNSFARKMCQSMSFWHLTSFIFLLYIDVFQYFTVSLFVWLFVEKVDLCLRILNNTEPVTQKTCCQNLTSKQCLLKWLGLARRREEILYPVSSNLLSLSSEPWPKIISYFAINTLIFQDII